MSRLLFAFLLFLSFCPWAEGQTILQGQVANEVEALAGATVKALQNGEVVRGSITDLDGNYQIVLEPGIYDIEFSYTGYKTQRIEKTSVLSEKVNSLNIGMGAEVFRRDLDWVPLVRQEQHSILQGIVSDSQEPLVGATVKAMQNGKVIRGSITDLDGIYRMSLDSGSYEVEISYVGYSTQRFETVQVLSNKINLLDVVVTSSTKLEELTGCYFGWWLNWINMDGTESGRTFTADQLRHMY